MIDHSYATPFGFDREKFYTFGATNTDTTRENMMKIAAYIPVIGTILGILRIVGAAKNHDTQYHDIQPYDVLRGIIETLSIGIILLPLDLIIYAKREFQMRNEETEDFA